MPRGPKGEKRPADVIGNAVHIMRVATGEIEEKPVETGKEYALKGGRGRAESLTPERRRGCAQASCCIVAQATIFNRQLPSPYWLR
jgi:hypothetical protein